MGYPRSKQYVYSRTVADQENYRISLIQLHIYAYMHLCTMQSCCQLRSTESFGPRYVSKSMQVCIHVFNKCLDVQAYSYHYGRYVCIQSCCQFIGRVLCGVDSSPPIRSPLYRIWIVIKMMIAAKDYKMLIEIMRFLQSGSPTDMYLTCIQEKVGWGS